MKPCENPVKCGNSYKPKKGDVFHSDYDCAIRYLVVSDKPAEGRETVDWSTGQVVDTYPAVTYDADVQPDHQLHNPAYVCLAGPVHLGPRDLNSAGDDA